MMQVFEAQVRNRLRKSKSPSYLDLAFWMQISSNWEFQACDRFKKTQDNWLATFFLPEVDLFLCSQTASD